MPCSPSVRPSTQADLGEWINDYFYRGLEWVLNQDAFVVATTMVGTVKNGLSHIRGATTKADFVCGVVLLGTAYACQTKYFSYMRRDAHDYVRAAGVAKLGALCEIGMALGYLLGGLVHGWQ